MHFQRWLSFAFVRKLVWVGHHTKNQVHHPTSAQPPLADIYQDIILQVILGHLRINLPSVMERGPGPKAAKPGQNHDAHCTVHHCWYDCFDVDKLHFFFFAPYIMLSILLEQFNFDFGGCQVTLWPTSMYFFGEQWLPQWCSDSGPSNHQSQPQLAFV